LVAEAELAPDVSLPLTCEVQVRYRAEPVPARVVPRDDRLEVLFDQPVMAVVPGQYAVFFRGDRVLGGGVIRSASTASERQAG
jgi:tRNA-specific 2-thiouridylase